MGAQSKILDDKGETWMMKRIMACLLAFVCLLTFTAFAEGITMKVVNVKEAVNLRSGPSTDTESLGLVPVGTLLEGCEKAEGTEWYAVNFNGVAGYIRGDKLEAVEAPAEAPAEEPVVEEAPAEEPVVEEAPAEAPAEEPVEQPAEAPAATEGEPLVAEGQPLVAEGEPLTPAEEKPEKKPKSVLDENVEDAPVQSYADVSEYNDDFVILDTVAKGVRVIGRQIYQQDCEYLMAVGLDESGAELWKNETTTDSITELMQTDVFIGGTADAPLVMMYNACRGLTAVDPVSGEVVWEISKKTLNLGGSITHVVDGNGVLYIGGYYGPDPVAIDAGGNVLWQSDSGSAEATWLYRMELTDEGIACSYGKMADAEYGTIVYDFNGNVVSVVSE